MDNIDPMAIVAKPFVKGIIETFVVPKLATFLQKRKTDKAVLQHAFNNKFEEYLLRSYEKQLFVNTLVFQNEKKTLKELYIPLTVEEQKLKKLILTGKGDEKSFKIKAFKDDFLPCYKKVLITETAGMGKSTLLKGLFLSAIEKEKGIPVFIELGKLK